MVGFSVLIRSPLQPEIFIKEASRHVYEHLGLLRENLQLSGAQPHAGLMRYNFQLII